MTREQLHAHNSIVALMDRMKAPCAVCITNVFQPNSIPAERLRKSKCKIPR
jgi:2-methylisocitrate lyase-like PEP mutase family enzyme